jgi:YVTN family beta-propeller protein
MKFALALVSAIALVPTLPAASVRIYQTNSAGDDIHVIDPATNKVVLHIKDIEVPHGVTFAPDGSRAYVSCESDNTLKFVDAKTGKIVGSAPLTGHPNNVSTSKDGKYVFVAIRSGPGAVDVVDTASMKMIKSIKIKGGGHNTYVTPDGKYAIAGSVIGKMLTVIDAKTLEIVWEKAFDQGVRPMTFETNPDGSTKRVFIQLSNLHGFAVLDFATHQEVARIELPKDPHDGHAEAGAPSHGIGVAPDGKTLWVNSSVASGVFVYSLPDLKPLGHVRTGIVPDWLTFTPDGKKIYVANSGDNNVSAIDTATRKEIAKIPVGEVPKRNGTLVTP